MERLTLEEAIKYLKEVVRKNKKNNEKNTIIIPNSFISSDDCAEKYGQVAEWLEELKTYKTLEEQGLLVRLPVPIGTKVYLIAFIIMIIVRLLKGGNVKKIFSVNMKENHII